MALAGEPTNPVAQFLLHFPSLVPIGDTHPRPGVSQVESLRFLLSELRGSMELSPSPLIVCTYQHLTGRSKKGNKEGVNRGRVTHRPHQPLNSYCLGSWG